MNAPARLEGILRRHGRRVLVFGAIGLTVFIAGSALQWKLLRLGVSSDMSYAVQTVFSAALSYLLNRWLTWRDRHAPVFRSALRWAAQRVTLIPNIAFYGLLVRELHLHWMVANAIATVSFTGVNYLAGDLWSFRARQVRRQAPASTSLRLSAVGTLVASVLLAAPVAIVAVPQARPLVYAAWMLPLAELALLGAGTLFFRTRFRDAAPGTFTELVIQITTAGNEADRVGEIIEQIDSYDLSMPYHIWVVTEPRDTATYKCDYQITVPASFRAQSQYKCRALEYSRRERERLGLDRRDVKIIFNDDDVTLTKGYIERAFDAGYDVCEGIITPRTRYAVRPFGHFLASHADDIRTHACLVYCSVFQGIFKHPVHVHGEGMVTTGYAESVVTWDWPVVASEDLVFGQRAAKAGLRWGWFHEYAEVTSPWTLREYLIQRRRWLWGDIHAMRYRSVMPLGAAARVLLKYCAGVLALCCSIAGLYLRASGKIPATAGILNFGKLALLGWVAVSFACGWIGASSGLRDDDSRLMCGVLAVIMMPVSALLTLAALVIPLAQGDPREFATIKKTK